MTDIVLYDTTLRDGTQGANISFTAEEKIAIARRLDEIGIHYIEGGWPGSNPRDMRFFELAKETEFSHAKLVAFSSTRRANTPVADDKNLQTLLAADTPCVAMFGKSWDLHVTEALGTTLEENLSMINESVAHFKAHDREVIYDAEQFFDGFKANNDYALQTLLAAARGGADFIALCDTNGGSLPHEIEATMTIVKNYLAEHDFGQIPLGIHAHNDCGLAVANSITAIRTGAKMVQGTINGYGERTGNADLTSIIPILCLKMNEQVVSPQQLTEITSLARFVSRTANMTPVGSRPFVGKNAFAHKAGVHVSAVMKNASSYEHADPSLVGNSRRVLVSDLAGKSNIEFKAQEFGVEFGNGGFDSREVVSEVKQREEKGFQYDVAEGSFKVLMEKMSEQFRPSFELESLRVIVELDRNEECFTQATLKIAVDGKTELVAAEGKESVAVLDQALRKVLLKYYPELADMRFNDLNVRVIGGNAGEAARTRVLVESADDSHRWGTMGVSENIIEASWQALADSFQYKISHDRRS